MAVVQAAARTSPPVRSRLLARVVCATPDLVPSAVAGFALPAIVLLLAGHFSPGWVLPIGTAGAALAMVVCGVDSEPVDRRVVICTLAAIGIALAWLAVNSFFSAENVFAHRDPATYDLAGRWLMDHAQMPIPTHPEIFGPPDGYYEASAGFGQSEPGQVYAQGNHLLPAMLAAVGWLFGATALLKANIAFGAAALLVVFGLARRVVGPQLALVAMVTFAVSMPLVFVSRDTYSEPLALLFLMGGLALLQRAIESGRVRDFGLAGFVAALAAPVRIDSDVGLLAIPVAAAALLVFAAPERRRRVAAQCAALLGAMAVPILVGWLDVTLLSRGYYHDERHHIVPIFYAGFALLVILPVVVAVSWRPAVRRLLAAPALPHRAIVAAGVLIAATFAFLVSRPLWLTARGQYLGGIMEVQRRAGEKLDGNRSYTENTVKWLAMYLGWPTVLLGVVGYFLLVRRSIRTRSLAMVGMLTAGLALTLLYLMSAQITPDQPWASRRYVPVVIPLLVIAAAYTVSVLLRRRALWLRVAAVAGALAMIVLPALVTAPLAGLREEVPQLAQVKRICAQVAPHGALLTVDRTSLTSYAQTFRSYCDVPTIGLDAPSSAVLAEVRRAVASHGRTLYLLSTDPSKIHFVAGADPTAPFSEVHTTRWPSTLYNPPTHAAHETVVVYLATVRPDGLAEPVVTPGS
jgi:MFS family permease